MRYLILLTIAASLLFAAACYEPTIKKDSRTSETTERYDPGDSATPSPTASADSNNNSDMNTSKKNAAGFEANLPAGFVEPTDSVGKKLLKEYGSVFVSRATPPTKVVYKDQGDVSSFQSSLQTSSETIGGFNVTLQTAAMNDLKAAISDAKAQGLSISPRGADSAKRSYDETVGLWKSRVDPALKHWTAQGKLSSDQAAKIAAMSPYEQVSEVLKLEEQGMYFAKDLSKSIIYSVAPPGTSQHLSMLALDVKEFENAKVREILAAHGWFQTVASDLPHFTYIGAKESELSGLGLKKTTSGGRTFWVPDIQ
jgi:hypothetical protein